MSLTLKESTIICPSATTPRRRLWLSQLDFVGSLNSHVPVIYIYNSDNNNNNNNNKVLDTKIIKESLSNVLVPFYPVAGRLTRNDQQNGRVEIDCNAAGVLFEEAETTHPLSYYGELKSSNSELRKLVLPTCDYSGGLSSFPLVLLRLTRFKCGSVCLAFVSHHYVADGIGQTYFFNSWATLARGAELSVLPVHERSVYLGTCDDLPLNKDFHHIQFEPPLPPSLPECLPGEIPTTTDGLFELSKHQINALKLEAAPPDSKGYKPSTFEVLAGHVWRSTCKARGLTGDECVKLYTVMDGRSRLKDTLPEGYFGNVIMKNVCIAKAKDVTCKPLWYTAMRVHEAQKRLEDPDYWRSAINYLESNPNVMASFREGKAITCPNLIINSFGRLPLYEADFGWGKPIYVGYVALKGESYSYLIPNNNWDGSLTLDINLFTPHMSLLKDYLYNNY